jgi:hypothetical protein
MAWNIQLEQETMKGKAGEVIVQILVAKGQWLCWVSDDLMIAWFLHVHECQTFLT